MKDEKTLLRVKIKSLKNENDTLRIANEELKSALLIGSSRLIELQNRHVEVLDILDKNKIKEHLTPYQVHRKELFKIASKDL